MMGIDHPPPILPPTSSHSTTIRGGISKRGGSRGGVIARGGLGGVTVRGGRGGRGGRGKPSFRGGLGSNGKLRGVPSGPSEVRDEDHQEFEVTSRAYTPPPVPTAASRIATPSSTSHSTLFDPRYGARSNSSVRLDDWKTSSASSRSNTVTRGSSDRQHFESTRPGNHAPPRASAYASGFKDPPKLWPDYGPGTDQYIPVYSEDSGSDPGTNHGRSRYPIDSKISTDGEPHSKIAWAWAKFQADEDRDPWFHAFLDALTLRSKDIYAICPYGRHRWHIECLTSEAVRSLVGSFPVKLGNATRTARVEPWSSGTKVHRRHASTQSPPRHAPPPRTPRSSGYNQGPREPEDRMEGSSRMPMKPSNPGASNPRDRVNAPQSIRNQSMVDQSESTSSRHPFDATVPAAVRPRMLAVRQYMDAADDEDEQGDLDMDNNKTSKPSSTGVSIVLEAEKDELDSDSDQPDSRQPSRAPSTRPVGPPKADTPTSGVEFIRMPYNCSRIGEPDPARRKANRSRLVESKSRELERTLRRKVVKQWWRDDGCALDWVSIQPEEPSRREPKAREEPDILPISEEQARRSFPPRKEPEIIELESDSSSDDSDTSDDSSDETSSSDQPLNELVVTDTLDTAFEINANDKARYMEKRDRSDSIVAFTMRGAVRIFDSATLTPIPKPAIQLDMPAGHKVTDGTFIDSELFAMTTDRPTFRQNQVILADMAGSHITYSQLHDPRGERRLDAICRRRPGEFFTAGPVPGGRQHGVSLWRLHGTQAVDRKLRFAMPLHSQHRNCINSIVTKDDIVFTGSADGCCGIYDLVERKVDRFLSPGSPINHLHLNPSDPNLLAMEMRAKQEQYCVWDLRTRKFVRRFGLKMDQAGEASRFTRGDFSSIYFTSAGLDGTIRIWDLRNLTSEVVLTIPSAQHNPQHVLLDGKDVISLTKNRLQRYRISEVQ